MGDNSTLSQGDEPLEKVVSRESLYEQAWSTPLTKLAGRYGVTTSYLVKVFKLLNIPRPPVGYWSQVAVGKGGSPPELPAVLPELTSVWNRSEGLTGISKLPAPPRKSKRKRIKADTGLPRRHPLLLDIEEHFKKVRESNNGYIRPTKRAMADLIVSRTGIDQAVEFANQLYLALMKKGFRVDFSDPAVRMRREPVDHRADSGKRYSHESYWWPHRPTVVYIGSVVFGLTIFEVSEYVPVKHMGEKYVRAGSLPAKKRPFTAYREWVHSMDMPSGRLGLQVYSPYHQVEWVKRWVESRPCELIDRISGIVKLLIAESLGLTEKVREQEERNRHESQKRQLEWEAYQRREVEKRRLKAVQDSRDSLDAVIQTWAKVKSIQAFFDEIERSAKQLEHEKGAALMEQLAKAKALIGDQDVLKYFEAWVPPST